jgi:hypothetical protein
LPLTAARTAARAATGIHSARSPAPGLRRANSWAKGRSRGASSHKLKSSAPIAANSSGSMAALYSGSPVVFSAPEALHLLAASQQLVKAADGLHPAIIHEHNAVGHTQGRSPV